MGRVRDEALRSVFGKRGRERIIERFSVEAYREVYLRVFSVDPPLPPTPKGEGYTRASNQHLLKEDIKPVGDANSQSDGEGYTRASNQHLLKEDIKPIEDANSQSDGEGHSRASDQHILKEDVHAESEEAEDIKNSKSDPLKLSGMHYGASAQIFDNARKLRENMTPAELKLWEYLRKRPMGCKFRAQHPIHKYVLDFYCHSKKLSIEIDGLYHDNKEQQEKDQARNDFLKDITIKEIRFSNDEVFNHFQEVVAKIENEIR